MVNKYNGKVLEPMIMAWVLAALTLICWWLPRHWFNQGLLESSQILLVTQKEKMIYLGAVSIKVVGTMTNWFMKVINMGTENKSFARTLRVI